MVSWTRKPFAKIVQCAPLLLLLATGILLRKVLYIVKVSIRMIARFMTMLSGMLPYD